ncbi:CGNR zinc finger domain-containing protein [Streptomyces sp. NPDC059445]|uniref:CGNR zinc finger domain-containing protein n=1 Tax=Streptomyces sp. NPDC059445 TaxID=3346832 RepID=UPI00367A1C6D
MNDRAPAPGGLALVQALVNTLDLESGADSLDTPEGLARFGLTAGEAAGARELRESLRAVCLAHAGHPAHRKVTPLGELLARAPLRVTLDADGGTARLVPAAEPMPEDPAGASTPVRASIGRAGSKVSADSAAATSSAGFTASADSVGPAPAAGAAQPSPVVPLAFRVAAAIADSLVEGTWPRLKACEAPTCHWAYFDRSPAGRGRWCSMAVCGARAKMRRYRAK